MIPQVKEISSGRKSAYHFTFELSKDVYFSSTKENNRYMNYLSYSSGRNFIIIPLFQDVCLSRDDIGCLLAEIPENNNAKKQPRNI